MSSLAMADHYLVAWEQKQQQEQRFNRIRLSALALVGSLCLLIAALPTPPQRFSVLDTPPPPIKLDLRERSALLPLPVAVSRPTPAAVAPEPLTPAPSAKPLPAPPQQAVRELSATDRSGGSPAPGPSARERAAAAGIDQLANELASLQDSSAASKAITGRADLTGTPRPNATAEYGNGASTGPGSERSLITARAGAASEGINNAQLSRGYGSGGLAGRGTTQVAGYGGGGTGEGPGSGRGGKGGGGGGNGNGLGSGTGSGSGAGGVGSRSREEIEMVFDQNKGAIYALYNRALRGDPSLQGKMVLELTIQPNGSVSACRVVSSELDAPEFQRQLVQRVLLFRFAAKDVAPVTTTKPLDFFPS